MTRPKVVKFDRERDLPPDKGQSGTHVLSVFQEKSTHKYQYLVLGHFLNQNYNKFGAKFIKILKNWSIHMP